MLSFGYNKCHHRVLGFIPCPCVVVVLVVVVLVCHLLRSFCVLGGCFLWQAGTSVVCVCITMERMMMKGLRDGSQKWK